MADCVLVEGLPVCENMTKLTDSIMSGSEDSTGSNTLDSVKSEFFLCRSDALCTKFQLNGVMLNSSVNARAMDSVTDEYSSSLKSITEEDGHNCRKKRCADRYDSSESSDSGVATLSCTDCSASSSSCGTSDITELGSPGSPFSTSSHSESDTDMPPTQWPWDRGPEPRSYLTASPIFPAKRPRSASADTINNNTRHSKTQGKITEYFKTKQKKADSKKTARLSGTFVPAENLISDFRKEDHRISSSLICRKSYKPSSKQVTSVFCEPENALKSSLFPSVLNKPKTPVAEGPLQTACSIPTEPLESLLSVSTSEQFSEKPSLPSPILRTPSIIRFPARNGWKGHFLSDIICRWSGCDECFSTTTALLEHLQIQHVNTQSLNETFVCLWIGCKVYERASCSRSWLERHVLSHGGNKPFRCIVDGCGQRFSSQTILERHVNQHFSQSENSSSSYGSNKKSLESTPNKLFRRNGKKLRLRRQPFSARMFDYMDPGMMEGLQHNLLAVSKTQTVGQVDCTAAAGSYVTLQAKVIGTRSSHGTTSVLLRWFPRNIVEDEWVPQSSAQLTRQVPWRQCDSWVQSPLFHLRPSHNRRKHSHSR